MNEIKKKILIVEDDEHILRIYELKFAKEGYTTSIVTSGDEAVGKIIAEKPDLIILDLMIPRKDGFEILEELKNNPETMAIPVLVLSNLGSEMDISRALGLGAIGYMIKVNHSFQEVVDNVKNYFLKN